MQTANIKTVTREEISKDQMRKFLKFVHDDVADMFRTIIEDRKVQIAWGFAWRES